MSGNGIQRQRDAFAYRFAARSEQANSGGDCYEAALRYLLDNRDNPAVKLVHGEVSGQGPLTGKTYGHAWIEVFDPDEDLHPWVIDPSNKGDLHMPKDEYYALGKITNTHTYDFPEAAQKAQDHGVYGPWDLVGTDPNYMESKPADHRQRQANSYRYANDLVKEYTDQLYDEFHDWAREQEYVPVGFEKNDPRVINPDYTKQMNGPLSYWDNIEGFLKDKYPAAHRDYRYGEENASDALDGRTLRMPARYSPWPNRTWHPPYETGPEAIEKYGYDPRQVAAGFMYLHTWSHAQSPQNKWRGDKLPRDIDRLAEIFQKRQQMQRDYEQRQAQ